MNAGGAELEQSASFPLSEMEGLCHTHKQPIRARTVIDGLSCFEIYHLCQVAVQEQSSGWFKWAVMPLSRTSAWLIACHVHTETFTIPRARVPSTSQSLKMSKLSRKHFVHTQTDKGISVFAQKWVDQKNGLKCVLPSQLLDNGCRWFG